MGNIREKITALVCGVVAGALLMEGGLRLYGVLQAHRDTFDRAKAGNAPIVICVGDSFTYGMGAPEDKSYPRQLDGLLNARGDGKYSVVNMGMPGNNSTQLIEVLRFGIDNVQPKMVVLLVGGFNLSNFYGYNAFKEGQTPGARFKDCLQRVRLYKLVALLFYDVRKKEAMSQRVEHSRRVVAAHDLADFERYCYLAQKYRQVGDIEKRSFYCKKVLEIDPTNIRANNDLSCIESARGNSPEAIRLLETAIAADPENPDQRRNYDMLFQVYGKLSRDDGFSRQIRKFFGTLKKTHLENDRLLRNVLSIAEESEGAIAAGVNRWIEHDIAKMIDMCRDRRIPVLLQNYPQDGVNAIVNEIADKYHVPLVDNKKTFGYLLQTNPKKEYFAADGHCNAKGYGVMARNVFDTMRKEGFIH